MENTWCLVGLRLSGHYFLESWGRWWCGWRNPYLWNSSQRQPHLWPGFTQGIRDPTTDELQMMLVKARLTPARGCCNWKPECKVSAGSSAYVREVEALQKGQQRWQLGCSWESGAGYNILCWQREKEIKVESSEHFLWTKVCPVTNCTGLCSQENQHSGLWLKTSWLYPGRTLK